MTKLEDLTVGESYYAKRLMAGKNAKTRGTTLYLTEKEKMKLSPWWRLLFCNYTVFSKKSLIAVRIFCVRTSRCSAAEWSWQQAHTLIKKKINSHI